jgi:preprotein translocase subunit SecA
MANFIEKLFGSIFGNKNDRERKALQPLVDEINAEYEKLKSLSNDELRHKTVEFKARIKEYLTDIDKEIANLVESANAQEDLHEKENIFKQVDEQKKQRDKLIEEVLQEILPQAFAVVKEAAYRFTNNPTLEATATDSGQRPVCDQ